MPSDPFQSDEYRTIQREHLMKTIGFLLEQGLDFAVAAEVEYLDFEPELPESIAGRFQPISLFVLTGYTFESSSVDEEALRFEAGFGEENYGAWVTIPLLAIKQVIVGEQVLVLNIAEPAPKIPAPDPSVSMEALLKNPENLKLLKKKRK